MQSPRVDSIGGHVLLLQLPTSVAEDIAPESYSHAKDFYTRQFEGRAGRLSEWMYQPSPARKPGVIHSVVSYFKLVKGVTQKFAVNRVQKVRATDIAEQQFQVQSVVQRREWVRLYVDSHPDMQPPMVVRVTGVHPSLDGCHLMKKARERNVWQVAVSKIIFPGTKSPSRGLVAFVGRVETDSTLYEIRLIRQQEEKQFVHPSQMDWKDARIASSEDEEDVPERSTLTTAVVPTRVSYLEEVGSRERAPVASQQVLGRPVSSTTSHRPLSATEDWGAVQNFVSARTRSRGTPGVAVEPTFPAEKDPKQYLMEFYHEDREMFYQYLLSSVLRHEAFDQLLRLLIVQFGKTAVSSAFDHPSSQPVSETTDGAATESHWSAEHNEDGKAEGGPVEHYGVIPPIRLRGYQSKTVDQLMNPGNFLVAAGTGSGKTWIFIEVSRRMLMRDPTDRIVVVVPKIALTTQHEASFVSHGFQQEPFAVGGFTGSSSADVRKILANSVIIITAEKLHQHLIKHEITFSHIQLLVLDEVHHSKGRSPYQNIMEKYKYLSDEHRAQTKVIGLSATPFNGRSVGSINDNTDLLLKTLFVPEKNIINIGDDNEEIRECIPQAKLETFLVKLRPDDLQFRQSICHFVGSVLTEMLPSQSSKLGVHSLNAVRLPAYLALVNEDCSICQFQQWRFDITTKLQASDALPCHKEDIEKSVFAICIMDEAVQQSKELGHESAVAFLIDRLRQMNAELERDIMACETTAHGSLFKRMYQSLYQTAYMKMLPSSVLSHGAAAVDCGGFPKFAKLIEVLKEYQHDLNFHGMVFVRTRSAVHQLCAMLQSSPLLSFVRIEGAVGQAKKRVQGQMFLTPFEQGMSLAQLNTVLDWFKEDGNKVLVTTNVSEEGIDVISCELVVRYSSTVSGTEFIQSRGRARKKGARFVSIVEEGSKDAEYLKRSAQEAEDSKKLLLKLTKALQI